MDRDLRELLAEHFRERLRSLLEVLVDRIRVRTFAVVAAHVPALLVEHHQGLGILHWQQAQQQLIHQRENRRVSADAERKREDCDGGKQRTTPQGPQRERQVREDSAHGG